MKFKVLKKCTLTIGPNSIVELDPMQAQLAKGLVALVEEQKEQKQTTRKRTVKKRGSKSC